MMRVPRAAVVVLVPVIAIATAAVASAGPHDAALGRLAADGPVTISSNRPGVALLRADHVVPGDKVSGTVSLTNKGDVPGDLALGVTGEHDTPGIYGGKLSNVLKLKIEDLGGRVPAREVLVRNASTLALGKLNGRETRSYRVTATFPDGGMPAGPAAGDNLLKGASVNVALQWQLTAPDPAPNPTPGPTSPQPGPVPEPPPSSHSRPLLLTLRVPKQRVLKPRGIKAYALCEIACKVRITAKTDNAPLKKHKKRKTLQKKKVLKGERKWRKLKAGREKRIFLQMRPKARRKLKKQMHGHGRAGITIIVHMRSSAGSRTAKRRIVMRTYKSAKHHAKK
jgi:hypothetical protein